jgi:hypothetical protein
MFCKSLLSRKKEDMETMLLLLMSLVVNHCEY